MTYKTGQIVTADDLNAPETSTVRATSTTEASLTSTGHALQTGPTSGLNLAVDGDEIQARNNGAAGTLYLNAEGGLVSAGAGGLATTGNVWGAAIITGSEAAANTVLNGNQLYARNAATANGDLYLNHASTGIVYLGQSGHMRVHPLGHLKTGSGYLHLNWDNGLPVAIGSSAGSVGRLGGSAGWQVDANLTVVGSALTYPNYPVAGSANASMTAAGLFQRISSSRRYKKNIRELTFDTDKVLDLIPRSFQFKHRFDIVDGELCELDRETAPVESGFIAEEAHDLGLGMWVDYLEDGTVEGFLYSNFVVAHQIVLREHRARIAELESTVADLAARLTALENGS